MTSIVVIWWGMSTLGTLISTMHHSKIKDDLATPVLDFYVTGLTSKLKVELGYLTTKGILSYQIMCTCWRAVMILENTCILCDIAVVSDGGHIIDRSSSCIGQ